MPENQFEKNNQELNKTNKTQEEINKKIKQGASLSKSMQDTLKKQADTLGKSEDSLKGMNSAAKNLNKEMSNVGKSTKKEASDTKSILTGRKALNDKIMEQVGFADKNAKIMTASMTYQKAYQKELANTNNYFVRGTEASKRMNATINEMRKQTRGMNDANFKNLNFLDDQGKAGNVLVGLDQQLIKNARLREVRFNKDGKAIQGFNKGYSKIVEALIKTREIGIDVGKNYDNIGKESFASVETEGRRSEIMAEMASISNRYFGANKKLGEELLEQKQAELDTLDVLDKKIERQAILDRKVKAAQSFITGPFEKLKSILDSVPGGGIMSEMIGVDTQMNKFIDDTRVNLVNAFNDPSPENLQNAMSNIGESGMKAVNGLVSGFKGLFKMILTNPFIAMTAALIAAGSALSAIFDGALETRKELGISFVNAAKLQSTINLTAVQFKLLGVSGEDVAAITDGIRANLGGTTQPSAELVKGFTSLVATTGISGENVTKLATQMMAVGASSQEAAMSQIESVAALARANNVAPGDILNDIASDSDLFASHAKDGGKNLAMAAITAKKLGLEMATVSKISDSLLSFEESINAQMEAQVLTGKNINTDKAREMALSGDLDGMQREITKQIGSAAEFERMNVVQRQALAGAFGVSVGELGKMITNQEKINNMTEAEKKSRDMIAGILKFIGGAMSSLMSLAKAMIPAFVGLGIAIAVAFYPVTLTVAGFVALGKAIEFLNTKFEYAGTILGTMVALATLFVAKMTLAGSGIGGKITGALGGIKDKMKGVVGGGAGGAGGVDELGKKGPGVGKGMKSLAKGVGAFANPKVILGLAALTVALIGVGFALKLAAPGIKAFGEAMGTIIKSVASGISTIIGAIGDFAVKLMTIASPTMALGLFATAAGFTALAGSMAVFAGAGLLALPALLALTAFNAVSGAGGGGEGENTTDTLLKEQITELKKMNAKLDMVTSNTKKGADEARSLNSSVIMA